MSSARVIRRSALAPPRHVRIYGATWIGYFALLLLLPVRYGTLQSAMASLSLIVWATLSALVAYAAHLTIARHGGIPELIPSKLGRPLSERELRRLISVSLILSIFGFVSLAYDRLVLQGIDFSQGVAVARQLWQRSGEGRERISSIFSVFGYLLGFTFFVATTLAHLHWERLSFTGRRLVIVCATVLVLGHSLLTGGRSIVLIQLAGLAATGTIRATLGQPMWPGRGPRIWLGLIFGLVISLGYSIYVFSARAESGGRLPELYATSMLQYLGGQPSDSFYALDDLPLPVATTTQFATVAGAYLTHSYGTFESVLEMQLTPGCVSFGLIRELLAKLGVAQPPAEDWLLSGRFLSVPGSLWYDFGWVGFYAGAVILGLMIGVLRLLVGMPGGGGVTLCGAVLILMTALLAPLLLAIDLLSVPFLVIGFLLIDGLNRAFAGPTSWIFVSRPVRNACIMEGVV